LIDEKDPYHFHGCFVGPDESPYSGGVFFFHIDCTLEYPLKPPKIKFTTRVFHPNIDLEGNMMSSSVSVDSCFHLFSSFLLLSSLL